MSLVNRRQLLARGVASAAVFSIIGRAQAQVPSTIRVGMSNQLPFAFLSGNGELTGQSPDVLRAALEGSAVRKVDGVLTEFGALIPGLLARRFDVICTGLVVRPDRCKLVAFGNPDALNRYALMVPKGNPKKIKSFEDIKANPQVKLAVLGGSISETITRRAGVPEAQWINLPDVTTQIAALKSGRADVALGSLLIIASTLSQMKEEQVEIVRDYVVPGPDGAPLTDYMAMGFRKEDTGLRELYNAGLDRIKKSQQLKAINDRWGLPLTPNEQTPPAETICST